MPLLALTVGSLAVLTAGCGGGGGANPSVANLGTTTSTASSTPAGAAGVGPVASSSAAAGAPSGGQFTMAGGSVASMMKFASCMRSHGVSNFPDPNSQGAISISSSSGIDPNSAQYTKAQQSCQTLMPGGGAPSPAVQHKMQMQALAYSACMRAHGLPGFPDPSFSGGAISLRISRSGTGGIDPNSPQFQSAQEACQGKLPGKPLGAVRAARTSVKTVGGASNGGG